VSDVVCSLLLENEFIDLGTELKTIIMTYGKLSPGKGIGYEKHKIIWQKFRSLKFKKNSGKLYMIQLVYKMIYFILWGGFVFFIILSLSCFFIIPILVR
jgi:hypothetical protein